VTGPGTLATKVRRRGRLALARTAEALLERRYGVESARHDTLAELGIEAADRRWHHPSDWISVRRALARLAPTPEDVFVDFGSGRGRAVLLAAGFPFRRVVGVELSDRLTAVARENLRRYRGRIRCAEVEFVTADATEYEIPDDLTVAYLYAPFGGDVFAAWLRNLLASLDRTPRVLRLVFNYPSEHNRLIASGRAEVLSVGPRSWPARREALDDVIVTYLLLPEGGRARLAGRVPEPDATVDRAPGWRGTYDPGFHFG
jgi:hypothetical protein